MPEQESKRAFREDYYEERRERERRKAKKQKQTKSSKASTPQTAPVQSELQKNTENRTRIQNISKEIKKNIMVPVLNLRKPAISFKTASLALDYPKEKKEHQLIVPKFGVFSPAFEFLSSKLDTSFPIKKKTRTLVIPNVKLLKSIIEFSEGRLDVDYSISKQERKVFIPKFVFQKPSMSFETASLNVEVLTPQLTHHSAQPTVQARRESVAEINKELMESIQPQEKITQASYAVEAQTGSGEEEVSGEELQGPLEFLFGKGARKVKDVEPLVILFKDYEDDSYIQTFEVLLYRFYREKIGGKPSVKSLSLRKSWSIKEIEQWLDEGKSVKKIKFDKGGEDLDITELANRLDAMFSEGAGIVILYAKNEKEFEEIESKIGDICTTLEGKPEIIKVKAPKLSLQEKIKLAQLLFGNVSISEEDLIRASATSKEVRISNGKPVVEVPMDTVLNIAMKKYKQKLERIWSKYPFLIKRNIGEESPEHVMGKAFIAYTLVKKLEESGMIPKEDKKKNWDKIRKQWILSETEIPGTAIRPDITFKGLEKEEHYEFETLFEEGFPKIYEKLDKYNEHSLIVNIVVEPITAVLHAKDESASNFATLITMIKNGQIYGNLQGKVRFYTLDLKNEKLMPLEDYLKELRTWLSKVRK